MPLDVGAEAPAFSLPAAGGAVVSLSELIQPRGALLIFFKTTCPTCRIALPVYGRLHREYGDAVSVVAVAQDPAARGRAWLDERSFRGPCLDDASDDYAVSEAYGVTVVPTFILVDVSQRVAHTSQAWDRDASNDWARRLAERAMKPVVAASTADDGLPVFKPG